MQLWRDAVKHMRKPFYMEGEKDKAVDAIRQFVATFNQHFPCNMTHYLHILHSHTSWFLGGSSLAAATASTQANEARHKHSKAAVARKSLHGMSITVVNASGQPTLIKHGAEFFQMLQLSDRLVGWETMLRIEKEKESTGWHVVNLSDLNCLQHDHQPAGGWTVDDIVDRLGLPPGMIHVTSGRSKFDCKDLFLTVDSITGNAVKKVRLHLKIDQCAF